MKRIFTYTAISALCMTFSAMTSLELKAHDSAPSASAGHSNDGHLSKSTAALTQTTPSNACPQGHCANARLTQNSLTGTWLLESVNGVQPSINKMDGTSQPLKPMLQFYSQSRSPDDISMSYNGFTGCNVITGVVNNIENTRLITLMIRKGKKQCLPNVKHIEQSILQVMGNSPTYRYSVGKDRLTLMHGEDTLVYIKQ